MCIYIYIYIYTYIYIYIYVCKPLAQQFLVGQKILNRETAKSDCITAPAMYPTPLAAPLHWPSCPFSQLCGIAISLLSL